MSVKKVGFVAGLIGTIFVTAMSLLVTPSKTVEVTCEPIDKHYDIDKCSDGTFRNNPEFMKALKKAEEKFNNRTAVIDYNRKKMLEPVIKALDMMQENSQGKFSYTRHDIGQSYSKMTLSGISRTDRKDGPETIIFRTTNTSDPTIYFGSDRCADTPTRASSYGSDLTLENKNPSIMQAENVIERIAFRALTAGVISTETYNAILGGPGGRKANDAGHNRRSVTSLCCG